METGISRRHFLLTAAMTSCATLASPLARGAAGTEDAVRPARFFFTSQGKTGMMHADGSGLRYLELDAPNQVTWQPCGFFPDGRRVLFLSMEPRRDGPGKPFGEYYHRTPTHIWIHDLEDGSLEEIATKERLAPFYTPQLLLDDGRMLVQVVRDGVAQSFNMNLDGTGAIAFTQAGEGMPYGLDLSPDGRRVAYHLAGPEGYQIRTSDPDGGNQTLVAKGDGHLYFCPQWSPDGQWLIFQDCLSRQDPGHDWSDLCLCRPDGSEQRMLTQGQALWFAATYGAPENHGGGSNVPTWTKDGRIFFCRRLPDSKVPWEFQAERPDTDHFNRDFKPELSRGGTELCRMDPRDGSVTRITHSDPPVWDFRGGDSPDGTQVLFCRAGTGEVPGIWVCDSDGQHARLLTKGLDNQGADHPRWIPRAVGAR